MGSLFKQKQKKAPNVKEPKVPDLPAPTRMPTIGDQAVQAEKMRTRQDALRRRGRLSTILTDMNTTGSSGKTLGA